MRVCVRTAVLPEGGLIYAAEGNVPASSTPTSSSAMFTAKFLCISHPLGKHSMHSGWGLNDQGSALQSLGHPWLPPEASAISSRPPPSAPGPQNVNMMRGQVAPSC